MNKGTKPTAPHLGSLAPHVLGTLLNVVAVPQFPCPVCDWHGPMAVHARGVRWRVCGHTRAIGPINPQCYVGCCHNRPPHHRDYQRKPHALVAA